VDRGAHQHALPPVHCRGLHDPALRAATRRGCGVVGSGLAQDRPSQ
jgi:hypothetical protein